DHEGQAERQAHVRQVQGDPPSRPRHGDLREPAPQAAPGLTTRTARPARPSDQRARPAPTSKAYADLSGHPGGTTPGTEAGARPRADGRAARETSANGRTARYGTPRRRRPPP